ncbi:MAG: hypothetical protein GY829_12320, partial [Gammaproteobacteria bacterium]|nr:hypothetical protein [Gammaproteobacteria bacterium]
MSKLSTNPQQLDVVDCYYLLLFLALGFSDSSDEISSLNEDKIYSLFIQAVNSETYDHIDGGFYSPEDDTKLLTINSNLINLLTKASGYFFEGNFAVPAINSAQWIIQYLQSETGAFFCGTKFDQTSIEYYNINFEHIKELLDVDGFTAFNAAYGINENTEKTPSSKIRRIKSYQQISDLTSMHIKQVPLALESARQQLIAARLNKKFPDINQYICCYDNCKFISTLFVAARQFNRDNFSAAALFALMDIQQNYWDNTVKKTKHYLSLLNALIMKLQYQWDENDFHWLIKIGCHLIESENVDTIFQAIKTNSLDTTVDDLFNLYFLSFNEGFLDLANSIANKMYRYQEKSSIVNISFLSSIMKSSSIQNFIVIRGTKYEAMYWQQQLNSGYKPYNHVYAIPETDSETLNT